MQIRDPTVLWTFSVAVAVFDVAFTWRCREFMHLCEVNPLAGLLLAWGGILAVVLFRASLLGYIWCMSRTRTRFSPYVLPSLAATHTVLFVILVIGVVLVWR